MPKLTELERTIRGLERCGYGFYAVEQGGTVSGILTLFPTADTRRRATPRTTAKWLGKWHLLQNAEATCTIANHLVGTRRTEAVRREKAEILAKLALRPYGT